MEKAGSFPWVRPRLKFSESMKTNPRASASSPSGRVGRTDSRGQLQGRNCPEEKPGTRVTQGWVVWPDPWMTFPWEPGMVTDGHGSDWHRDQTL